MRKSIARAAAIAGLSAALLAAAPANAVVLDLSTAVLSGGASYIANDGRIKFDPNVINESATFTFASQVGQQYQIVITGQNDSSTSFFNFFIDPDGPGGLTFTQLGGNVNFGSGFNTVVLPTFTDLGTQDYFRIVNGGTGNTAGQISVVSVDIRAVPGPIAGAGIPALLALGGVLFARRRRSLSAA